MSEYGLRKLVQTLLRFYRFSLPHWKLMLLALVTMSFYSLIFGGLALLVKPFIEGLSQGFQGTAVQASAEDRALAEKERVPESEAPSYSPLHRAKEAVRNWLSRLPLVTMVQRYVAPGPGQLKHVAYLVLFVIAPLGTITAFLVDYCTGRILWSVMADLRVAVFQTLSHAPLAFFTARRTGDLISRVTNDIASTMQTLRLVFEDTLLQPMKLIVLMGLALWTSWQLSLAFLVGLPVLLTVLRRYGGRIQKHGRKSLEGLGDITDAINQMFTGIRVVKAFAMEEEENSEFREKNRLQLRPAFKLVRSRALAGALPQLVAALCMGVVLLVGNRFLAAQLISVKDLGVVLAAVLLMSAPLKGLVKCYNTVRANMGAIDRVFELVDQEVQVEDAPNAVEIDGVSEGIRFNHVWFAYNDNQHVLRDMDLCVPRGTICAVVGETGAGKSTMLDLIPRFYDVAEGSVQIDGVDVRDIKRQSLMRQIAIVGQHPFLFNRSIAENIRYGRRKATDEQVIEAAKAAHIHEFTSSLPDGYDTAVGEQGGRLSGGQRQCVTIARALLKDAPILILDEATSSLDSESERLVQQALSNLIKGRSTFIIAHRLSTVRFADMIVVLKGGTIVEQGTHEELLARGGEYEKLYHLQFPA